MHLNNSLIIVVEMKMKAEVVGEDDWFVEN